MRLGKNKSIGQIIIDLTPLLDVVFILLIVVLSFQDAYSAEVDSRISEAHQIESDAKDMVSTTESKNATISEQLDTYANLNDYVNIVTIYADYQPSNRKYRTIYLVINDADVKEIALNPSNGDSAWKECEETIKQCLEENSDIPTIYTIKNEKMLYRDEQMITSLFSHLSSSYNNIYLKNYVETDDE